MDKAIVWMRRDIRLHAHHALKEATNHHQCVYVVFIFDPHIIENLPADDRRMTFISEGLLECQNTLREKGGDLLILKGRPEVEIPHLIKELEVTHLYFNRDYESYALKRDKLVSDQLIKKGIQVYSFKDAVFYEGQEILTRTGTPYKVFTPYKRAWYERLRDEGDVIPLYKPSWQNLAPPFTFKRNLANDISKLLGQLGFKKRDNELLGGTKAAKKVLKIFRNQIINYHLNRDFPALNKTSHLSAYLRHGMISVRDLLRLGFEQQGEGPQVWVSEIIWREFYQSILFHYPFVEKRAFREEYEKIKWRGGKKEFHAWCEGQTGYPIVDAAMRCLNSTGMMPNRLRMVTASFLCKTLLVDWRLGEQYFALKLLDYDKAANNGGWQWCSSTGTDACPYFRIFNPYNQSQKFDKEGNFIRQWCPELIHLSDKHIHHPSNANMFELKEADVVLGETYPYPIVHYQEKRVEALAMYKEALSTP